MSFAVNKIFENRYRIARDDEIILYGFNLYCREQIKRLQEEGYHIVGILDKNPEYEKEYVGIPFFGSVEELGKSDKTCVFMMLQNGMLHWDIAHSLYRHGINRIIFLPLKTGFYSREVQNEFVIQYNYMMENKYEFICVPYLRDEMFELTGERQWFEAKRLDSGDSIIWMAVDLVRTTMREEEKYKDIPISDFIPYIDLFRHLRGDYEDISEYIRIYGKAPVHEVGDAAYDYVVNKRIVLYDFFEEQFNSGNIEYFVASAPAVEWNEKGYFNLCEGQHRCVYLLSKGMKYVPVRIEQKNLNKIALNTGFVR